MTRAMTKQDVRARIEEIGIIPAVRVSSVEEALFAAETVLKGGIKVVEITTTMPGAVEVIAELTRTMPELMVGADAVLNLETAKACLDAGAAFLTSPGLDLEIVDLGARHNVLVIPGALTPSEVAAACRAGTDFIKVFPCSLVGGAKYIKALKGPFPGVAFIASGGVNQQTVSDFIRAGASALGIGEHLVPHEAVQRRNATWILELTRRFIGMVKEARAR
ncbi:MAG: bifunctional 4-hydroxy-2-oxoglutarate aldolase/2-dehydro-3-deoxy-phosphogluconate aldolase [Bryobacteraceae bacterium]